MDAYKVFSHSWRGRCYDVMFNINTRSGRLVELSLVLLILASVVMVFIESAHNIIRSNVLTDIVEVVLTVVFTLEYLLRLITTPREMKYPRSFFGLVDLITLLPVWVLFFFPGVSVSYTVLFRVLRVLRILRLMKVLRYMNSAGIIWQGVVSSYRQLLVFFFIISVVVCLFAGVMYVAEGPENGFSNLATALYWAVVTVTTVGYGDITPHTPAGRMISSLLIIIGYSIMAIPTGLLSANMTEFIQDKKSRKEKNHCSQCHGIIDVVAASFCSHCGYRLSIHKHTKDPNSPEGNIKYNKRL
ncbi:ion transporter [Enterobacter sp. J706]|uniref:ion transporter n=1 Tax=Enterobacter sp. J706 TaxID=3444321 RepID=UPI003EBECFE3